MFFFYIFLFLAVIGTAVTLSLTVLFRVERIEVQGESRYSAEQIVQASGLETGGNLFLTDTGEAASAIEKALPYIGEAKVSRVLPSELSISVQEEPAASAILWEGQYVVLGASGKVLELAAAAPENCPVVKGVALQQAEPGSAVAFADVLEIEHKKFDFLSFAESIFAFGGITLGVGNLSSYGLVSLQAGLPLLVGIVVCALFVLRQCKLPKPFLDVKILRSWHYMISVVASMVLYLVMMGSSVMMPLYVQSVMGYSAVISGLVTLPGSLATAIVSPLAGRMYDRMGIRKIFIAGAAALVISNAGMMFITMSTPLWGAAVLNVIRNLAIGSLMMPLLTWGTSSVATTKIADASSLLTSFRTIAGSIGSAVFVGIMAVASAGAQAAYGDAAAMHGMNVAFFWMAVGALILLGIAIFCTKGKRQAKAS